jgi:flagellar biosynthesis/type III secretory pathway protein FliH
MAREELKKSESEAEQRYFRVCVRSVLKDWILDLGDTSESILEAARKEIQRRVDEAHSEGFRKGRNMLQALARGEVTLSSLLDPAVRNKGG